MRRCQLGSEWERVQTKLKLLGSKNSTLNAYTARYNSLVSSRGEEQAIEALQESLKQTARCAPASKSEAELIRFDDGLIKQFYQTLVNYRTFLFRASCSCGSLGARKRKLGTSCIFCHLFRQYEASRTRSSEPEAEVDVNKLDADIRTVRVDHSYCKQPRCGSDAKTKRLNELFEQRDEAKLVDFDDGLIDKIINERLSRIFDGGSGKRAEKKKRQFKSIFSDGFELDLKQHENRFVDAGVDLSPSDIKKLPNLTYDEYGDFFF
jgi:hypothetical protein